MLPDPVAHLDLDAMPWLCAREFDLMDVTSLPRASPDLAGSEAERQRSLLTHLVRRSPGYALLRLGLPGASDNELCRAAWNLLTALCVPVPQYATGELLYPVEASGQQAAHSPYSASRAGAAPHNDGTFLPAAPEVTALLSLSAADEGGETLLVDGSEVVENLCLTEPSVASLLFQEHPVDVRGQGAGEPVRWQPIATWHATGRVHLRYLRSYLDGGYAATGRSVPAATQTALDRLDFLLAARERQMVFPLGRGDLLVFDNGRHLHGRRAFQERTSRRRLRRVYGMFR